MSLTFVGDPVVSALAPFASLPAWLAVGMDAGRVGASLVRHVPELAGDRLRLVACTPDRLRAKESEWLVRYTLRVTAPGEEPRDIVLVGNLWPPGQVTEVGSVAGADARFGDPGWRCRLPDLGLELHAQA
ncbi:MAG: hypothetical protein ACRDXB_08055, partial [Actinomycetes bacterium]